jgi:hypothetical protein
MTCGDEDYKHLDRVERHLKKALNVSKRIPYAVLFKTSVRAVLTDAQLVEAYERVIAQDNRYKQSKPARHAKR